MQPDEQDRRLIHYRVTEKKCRVTAKSAELPTNFTRDVIMKAPSYDIMNSMTRSVLTLASYDEKAGNLELDNVLRQCIERISIFPMLAVYAYHAYNHYEKNDSMYIHMPDSNLSVAENFLRMLRPDTEYTALEAQVLDVLLLLHMEHGGANIMVMQMMADIRKHVSDYSDEEEVRAYLEKILDKEGFDRRGLIYGMGHAVYLLEVKEE